MGEKDSFRLDTKLLIGSEEMLSSVHLMNKEYLDPIYHTEFPYVSRVNSSKALALRERGGEPLGS